MKIITIDTLNHQNYIEDHSDQLKQLHEKFATYACGSGYSNVDEFIDECINCGKRIPAGVSLD